jgi:rhamnosyltransferase
MTDLDLSRISGLEAELECTGVVAVVVTYQPQLDTLGDMLDALAPQVDAVVIVDNSADAAVATWLEGHSGSRQEAILLRENLGVAAAQNVGIARARERRAKYVVLFDQDSLPAPDMVHHLIEAVQAKQSTGCRVAAAGPRYIDDRQGNPPPFIRIQRLKILRQACDKPTSIVDVDYLISSGCLIPMFTLDAVGLMREDLFIDYVDIEWGLRAENHGFQSYGVCSARMQHSLGDPPIKFFGKNIPLHSPLRHYYHFRNAVLLYKEPWVPLNWKLVDGWRLFLKYVFYSLFAKPCRSHFRMMTLGVWHGLVRKIGKFK